jgi:aspartate aminotransferase
MTRAAAIRLSRLGTAVGESATLRQNARVAELRAAGRHVYNFTVGEPDCETPAVIRRAAHHAIDAGHTHYTPSAGTPELRAAVARHYSARHGIAWRPQQAIVSAGVKQVLWTALAALVEPGDEIVLVAPYWVSYAAYVKLLGAVARVVRPAPERDYKATGADLRAVLNAKTRVVLFNTPVNPTGAVYSRDEQRDLLAPLLDHDAVLVTDEIYENMVYGVTHVSPVQVLPELVERTVVTSGASKSYAMTGWRIGYGLGPEPLVRAMTSLQSHMTGNASSVSQRAALAALDAPGVELDAITALFGRRREICLEILRQAPEIRFPEPHGAFYFFLDVRPFYGDWSGGRRITDSTALAEHLLESHGLAVVPGAAFDNDGGVRVSYTLPDADLRTGLERLVHVLRERV